MGNKEMLALETMEHMSEREFQRFLSTVPRQIQARIENGTSNWRKILPKWFIKYNTK